MSPSAIIQRISAALAADALKLLPEVRSVVPVLNMGDLLRPWAEVYPGADPELETEGRDLFCWGGLCKPHFVPQPRRSARPLPPPLVFPPPVRLIGLGLFASVRGIWDYYQNVGKAAPALLTPELDSDSLQAFIQPLWEELSGYWPLCCPLETFPENDLDAARCGIPLTLPHYVYDQEESGVVEAFLSGPGEVESILSYLIDQDGFVQISPLDSKLIRDVGLGPLLEAFADYPGEKSCDLRQLANCWDVFFGEVKKRFPVQMENDWPIISGNGGLDADIYITSKEDIEFAIAYYYAWCEMLDAFPAPPYDFEQNDGGVVDRFVHEICEIGRKLKLPRKPKAKVKVLAEVL